MTYISSLALIGITVGRTYCRIKPLDIPERIIEPLGEKDSTDFYQYFGYEVLHNLRQMQCGC